MWNVLDSFGRPPAVPHFQLRALQLNQRALQLLEDCQHDDPAWSRSLFAVVTAGGASWHAFRFMLTRKRWQAVKESLRKQDKLLRPLRAPEAGVLLSQQAVLRGLAPHALTNAQRRCVERLMAAMATDGLAGLSTRQCEALESQLHDQSRWLGDLARAEVRDEAPLREGLIRIYRRARRTVRQAPGSGQARRSMARLAWMEELLQAPSGPVLEGRLPSSAAGRLWLGLEEDRWLRTLAAIPRERGLGDKDIRHLGRLVERRREALARCNCALSETALSVPARVFASRLPWMLFRYLAQRHVE